MAGCYARPVSWTLESKIRAIAAAHMRCFVPQPSTRIVREPRIEQVITPDMPWGSVNEVGRFTYAPEEADTAIDRVIGEYRSYGVPFKWVVAPGSSPPDLGERLEKRGLVGWWARGMASDTGGLALAVPSGVSVERVSGAAFDAYCEAAARGFDADLQELRRHAERQRENAGARFIPFLARVEGVPAGTAALGELGDHAYLAAASVVPEHRGAGVYRALIAARLAHCAERGISLAVTHAREDTSAPILEHLGFETVYRFQMFASSEAAPR
jgi:GNAT superfamily N-acetyltransferase